MEWNCRKNARKSKKEKRIIALPEATDVRILTAAHIIAKEDIATLVLVGNQTEIQKIASKEGIELTSKNILWRDPKIDKKTSQYADYLWKLRKEKGMTEEKAKGLIQDPVYFATMMVKLEEADGMVSGAIHSTSDTLRPALQIIKPADGIKTVSSFFLIEAKDSTLGENGVFVFSDCGLIEFPTEEQLVDITLASTRSFRLLTNAEPKVALLSYSTKGSAKNVAIDKTINVVKKLEERKVDFAFDGELQLDAAIIPEVASIKAKDSKVAGRANVLIFPNLEAGNIGYKMAQRFGNALAFGPITQGLGKPVNDLSRGCKVEDIIGTIAITCLQAK